jgi:GntR family transcriptional regulator of arabinose operon
VVSQKPEPKYLQIMNAIREQIRKGMLHEGDRIPSIAQLMLDFGVSKVTVVRALADLEAEGVIRREHGRGTFVNPPEQAHRLHRVRRTVAVIVPEMTNPFYVEVVGAVERWLRERGSAVEIMSTERNVEAERAILRRVTDEPYLAGAMLIAVPHAHEAGLRIDYPLPLIAVDYCPPDLLRSCTFVACDNYRGGYEAATHLAELGHRRIGVVHSGPAQPDRRLGFLRGLEEFGLDLPSSRDLRVGRGRLRPETFLRWVRAERLTAVFAQNDMLAMQVMQVLREGGFAVPTDVSLVGYDDVHAARYLEVPLTTINQHGEAIGRKAAETLLECIEARTPPPPREIVVVPQLVVRASTAPPKDGA